MPLCRYTVARRTLPQVQPVSTSWTPHLDCPAVCGTHGTLALAYRLRVTRRVALGPTLDLHSPVARGVDGVVFRAPSGPRPITFPLVPTCHPVHVLPWCCLLARSRAIRFTLIRLWERPFWLPLPVFFACLPVHALHRFAYWPVYMPTGSRTNAS